MQSERIRVLVVDDHPLMREGIVAVIQGAADIIVVGEAGNGNGTAIDSSIYGDAIRTVAVIPATRRTSGGTLSMRTCTGMRCASLTQVKMGLTAASPC